MVITLHLVQLSIYSQIPFRKSIFHIRTYIHSCSKNSCLCYNSSQMYFKVLYSAKQFGCVCILFCCLLTSVSHSTDTSEGVHSLPIDTNNNDDISSPPIPMLEEKDENSNSESRQKSDITVPDSSEESPQDPPPAKVGLSNSESNQPPSEQEDTELRQEETSQEDLLQLPTMDEFITQNKLKPDPTAQNTNGAASTDPSTPISSPDSSQPPTNSPPNGKEAKSNGQHQTPPKQKNYAASDCGAKIVATNPACRNAGGILNENRDDYMLNKCSLDAIWVTVELCDFIQVQSIELSVHELFSSLPENFTISLSDRRGVPPETWQPPTLFTAKNVRGVQMFRVPPAEQYHARFVRLSFLSHYGSEHYCPVTTLRVSGANVVEVLEAMESGSAGQEDEPLPVAPSLSLEANDSDPQEVGDRSSDGILSSALDGIYKLVWPGEEMVAVHNATDTESVEKRVVSLDLNGETSNVTEGSRDQIKVGLNMDNDTESGSMELSNDTRLGEYLNDTKLSFHNDSSYEHPTATAEENLLLNLNEGSNQTESKREEVTSSIESGNVSIDSPQTNIFESSNGNVNLTRQNQTSVSTESVGTVEPTGTELQDKTQHNTSSVPAASNMTDNTSTLEAVPPSASPKDPPPPNTPPTSQNYLVRMQERIARLGENVTLIHRYLDQFRYSIQRNVNRTEEVQRSLERKLLQLETHLNISLLHGYIQGEEFEYTKSLCADSNASIVSHVHLIKSLFLSYFILTVVTFVLIGIAFVRYFKKQLKKEMNFHSSQMNLELQKILNSLEDDRRRIANKKSARLRPLNTRTHESDLEHQTDQDVLSDSHVHTYAYSHSCVKKKKKTRKSSHFNIATPY